MGHSSRCTITALQLRAKSKPRHMRRMPHNRWAVPSKRPPCLKLLLLSLGAARALTRPLLGLSLLAGLLAKGLGSGVPIGAVVAGPKAANIFQPGNHGTTFGGNPLAMRAGVETMRIMEEDGLLENAARVGEQTLMALNRLKRMPRAASFSIFGVR